MNDNAQILTLARLAAPLRLQELANERAAILRTFPDLDPIERQQPAADHSQVSRSHHAPVPRKRGGWTKARRAAQARRIRAVWKLKRAGKPASK